MSTAFPIEASRARVREINADVARGEFLRKLDYAPFDVTEFEMNFIENFLGCLGTKQQLAFWTPRRRATVDEMMQRYAARL